MSQYSELIAECEDFFRMCERPSTRQSRALMDAVIDLESQLKALEPEWISEEEKARFWSFVGDKDYCWEWTGAKNNHGYGNFRLNGAMWIAPRAAYRIIFGGIPAAMCVCHRCDNPGCINPDHLFLSDHQGNMTDKQSKGRAVNKTAKSSKYNGVSWRNDSKKWRASIRVEGKYRSAGCFHTEFDAAVAADRMARQYFGNDCPFINFPLPSPPITSKEG